MVKGPYRKMWEQSFANELEQLAQGIITEKVTNTIIFIPKIQVHKEKSHIRQDSVQTKNQKKERKKEPDCPWEEICWTS